MKTHYELERMGWKITYLPSTSQKTQTDYNQKTGFLIQHPFHIDRIKHGTIKEILFFVDQLIEERTQEEAKIDDWMNR
ncbi:hypothetical protein KGQ29_03890 [Patescibacteria group bacterium]|nr:hypothetical protein [Patescibacteria group bacterium]